MKLLWALFAAFLAFAASSVAASTLYNVYDHSDGTQTDGPEYFDYGLRLDGLGGSTNPDNFWSFEAIGDGMTDTRNASLATLEVDFSAGANGEAYLVGQMRNNGTGDLWNLDVLITDLTVLGGSGGTTSFAASAWSGTLSRGAATFNLAGKTKNATEGQFTLAFGSGLSGADWRVGPLGETSTAAGWVLSANGFTLANTNDFLFTVELAPVPLPAGAWLLIGGLGALVTVKRRKT